MVKQVTNRPLEPLPALLYPWFNETVAVLSLLTPRVNTQEVGDDVKSVFSSTSFRHLRCLPSGSGGGECRSPGVRHGSCVLLGVCKGLKSFLTYSGHGKHHCFYEVSKSGSTNKVRTSTLRVFKPVLNGTDRNPV